MMLDDQHMSEPLDTILTMTAQFIGLYPVARYTYDLGEWKEDKKTGRYSLNIKRLALDHWENNLTDISSITTGLQDTLCRCNLTDWILMDGFCMCCTCGAENVITLYTRPISCCVYPLQGTVRAPWVNSSSLLSCGCSLWVTWWYSGWRQQPLTGGSCSSCKRKDRPLSWVCT